MKKWIYIIIAVVLGVGCSTLPKNYTLNPDSVNETSSENLELIHRPGYYTLQRGCDSTFFSIFRFFPNGEYKVATSSEISNELSDCFREENENTLCKNLLSGRYRIVGDTVKTQAIWPIGNGCVIFRDYLINDKGQLINTADYVEPEYSNLGYMKNYPSFRENPCPIPAQFVPIKE